MNIYLMIVFLLLYAIMEFIASFLFNYKIKMIDQKKHVHAAALGAISTVIFVFLTSFAALYAAINGEIWWFILLAAFMMAIGNMLSLLALGPFEKWMEKRKLKSNLSSDKDLDVKDNNREEIS